MAETLEKNTDKKIINLDAEREFKKIKDSKSFSVLADLLEPYKSKLKLEKTI